MRRRSLLVTGVAVAVLAAATAHSEGADPAQAVAFVKQAGNDLAVVVNGAHGQADKEQRLAAFIEREVDEDSVARFCLSRYWQVATPDQQAEYVRLFRKVLLRGVVSRLGDYQANSTKVTFNRPLVKSDGIYVPTMVERPGNKPVNVTWVVTADPNGMHVADVVAEGISLRQTQRSDYSSFLARNGGRVQALIEAMKKQVGE